MFWLSLTRCHKSFGGSYCQVEVKLTSTVTAENMEISVVDTEHGGNALPVKLVIVLISLTNVEIHTYLPSRR